MCQEYDQVSMFVSAQSLRLGGLGLGGWGLGLPMHMHASEGMRESGVHALERESRLRQRAAKRGSGILCEAEKGSGRVYEERYLILHNSKSKQERVLAHQASKPQD